MATEKRLILADATVDAFTKWLTSTYDGRMPVDVVNEIPTVDAVEVVRCRDCKVYDKDCGYCEAMGFTCECNDFCSYGERRQDDH